MAMDLEQVAGGAMSGTKRKVEELGGHVFVAAVGGVVDRAMSAAVGRFGEARTSTDDQLDRLRTLAIMLHSAVEAAEGVHIRSWWLRRWLWKLRDAALDGDEVLRLFRQQRATDETDAASRQAAGNMVWRALRSAKSMLFGRDDDNQRLSRMVARLEREAMGLGDFLKMLELEIRRSPPPVLLEPDHTGVALVSRDDGLPDHVLDLCAEPVFLCQPPRLVMASEGSEEEDGTDEHSICYHSGSPDGGGDDGSRSGSDHHGLSSISHEEYVAGVRKVGLRIVRQRIQRALDRLMRKKPVAAPPAWCAPTLGPGPDTDRLRELVASIRRAVRPTTGGGTDLELHRKRRWLARWRNQLLALAFRAEHQLLAAVSVQADDGNGDGDGADVMVAPPRPGVISDGPMRRTAQNVETAAAHLEDFVTLAGFALASLGRPCPRS